MVGAYKEPLNGLKRICESVRRGEQKLLVTLDKLMDIDRIRENEDLYPRLSALWSECSATSRRIEAVEQSIDSFDEWARSGAATEMLQYDISRLLRAHDKHGKTLAKALENAAPGP